MLHNKNRPNSIQCNRQYKKTMKAVFGQQKNTRGRKKIQKVTQYQLTAVHFLFFFLNFSTSLYFLEINIYWQTSRALSMFSFEI